MSIQLAEQPTPESSSPIPILERYYGMLSDSASTFPKPDLAVEFEPTFELPVLDDRMRTFLNAATASFVELGTYSGIPLRVMDLRQNSGTQTTKTFASTIIVARAVNHIQKTGQPILLFSPSSGNKAIALRDAVERALSAGLANPTQLRIATLTPLKTAQKLRRTILFDDPELRNLNPVFVLDHPTPEHVKQIGTEFKQLYRERGEAGRPKLWHSLKLDNYRFSDQARAFFDLEFGSAGKPKRRTLHVHAVSSAYGLLGYQTGIDTLRKSGIKTAEAKFLMVQHLATSDMVRHLTTNSFEESNDPSYHLTSTGEWRQFSNPHFPMKTWNPKEVLENTFYTQKPATADEMSSLIHSHGGSGIVVSPLECMERYAECRAILENSSVTLPADPRELEEWSLVMAITGLLNAIDRGLVKDVDGCTIHASGSYSLHDYTPIDANDLKKVTSARQMIRAV